MDFEYHHDRIFAYEIIHNPQGGVTMLKIGQKVPDFEVQAYHQDDVKKIKLSDYKGKWVVVLFYIKIPAKIMQLFHIRY